MLHLGSGECLFFFLQSQAGLTPEVPGSRFPRLGLLSRQTPSLSGEIRGNQPLTDGAWEQFPSAGGPGLVRWEGMTARGRVGSFVGDVLLKRNYCNPPTTHLRDSREGECLVPYVSPNASRPPQTARGRGWPR